MKIKIINGPNMNMLGKRPAAIYGSETLAEINEYIEKKAAGLGCEVSFFQSNSEGEIVGALQSALDGDYGAVLLNAAAYTHYSVAIRDAVEILSGAGLDVYEVHLSDPDMRESFRHVSVIRDVCRACVKGLGKDSYVEAIRLAVSDRK